MSWKRLISVVLVAVAIASCSKGGGPASAPTAPSGTTAPTPTRARLTATLQSVTGSKSTSGHDYSLVVLVREQNGSPASIASLVFTMMSGTTALGTASVDGSQAFPGGIAGSGTATSSPITISADSANHAYASAISLAVAYTDAVGALSVTATADVPALPVDPPRIDSFTVDDMRVDRGRSTTLRWTVSNADIVSINYGIGSVASDGRIDVSPLYQTTTYRLTARSGGGTETKIARVTVSDSQICHTSEVTSGATAMCRDGSSSQSQNRSGTCSSHNGVQCWVCPGPLCQ